MKIALLHPQCVRQGGAIQMSLQAAQILQEQGNEVTLFTFEYSSECFPELQSGLTIIEKREERREKREGFVSCPPDKGGVGGFGKIQNIIKLAWTVRKYDLIIATNPPMQIVAALAKIFSWWKVKTVWWHHHIPWYLDENIKYKTLPTGRQVINNREDVEKEFAAELPLNCEVRTIEGGRGVVEPIIMHKKWWKMIFLKWFFERFFIIPLVDEMIATSHFIAECVREYCGREATVIHPIIMKNEEWRMKNEGKRDCGITGLRDCGDANATELPLGSLSGNANGGGEGGVDEPATMYEKQLTHNDVLIFSHGRLEPGKGFEMLVQTYNRLKNEEWVNTKKYWYSQYSHPANIKLQEFSQKMSRQMTPAECRLWFDILSAKKTGYKWVKQKIIGNFIVDFYCHEKRLIIEVDGPIHFEQLWYDRWRTQYLESMGIRVVRFSNEFILEDIDRVRDRVEWEMAQIPPALRATPLKGGHTPASFVGTPLKGGLIPPALRATPLKGGLIPPALRATPLKGGVATEADANAIESGSLPLSRGCPTIGRTGVSEPNSNIHLILFGSGSLEQSFKDQWVDVRPYEELKYVLWSIEDSDYGITGLRDCGDADAAELPLGEWRRNERRGLGGVENECSNAKVQIPNEWQSSNEQTGNNPDLNISNSDNQTFSTPPAPSLPNPPSSPLIRGASLREPRGSSGDIWNLHISNSEPFIWNLKLGFWNLSAHEIHSTDEEISSQENSSSPQNGHALLGVYCSSIDGFGIAPLECQLSGIPTVILDRAGARETIVANDDDQPVGYLVEDEEELLRIISYFVQYKMLPKNPHNVKFSHHKDYFSRPRLVSDLRLLMQKIAQ